MSFAGAWPRLRLVAGLSVMATLLLDGAGLTEACLALDCGDERIDKVFFRNAEFLELEPLQWSVPSQFGSPEGAALSDHEPVAVRFAWTGIPAGDGDSGIGQEIYPEEISVITLNVLHGLSDEDPAAQPFDLMGSRVELIHEELSARGDALVALQEVALLPMEGYPDLMESLLSALGRGTCPAYHALFGAVGGAAPVPVDGGVLWPSDHVGLGCVLR